MVLASRALFLKGRKRLQRLDLKDRVFRVADRWHTSTTAGSRLFPCIQVRSCSLQSQRPCPGCPPEKAKPGLVSIIPCCLVKRRMRFFFFSLRCYVWLTYLLRLAKSRLARTLHQHARARSAFEIRMREDQGLGERHRRLICKLTGTFLFLWVFRPREGWFKGCVFG